MKRLKIRQSVAVGIVVIALGVVLAEVRAVNTTNNAIKYVEVTEVVENIPLRVDSNGELSNNTPEILSILEESGMIVKVPDDIKDGSTLISLKHYNIKVGDEELEIDRGLSIKDLGIYINWNSDRVNSIIFNMNIKKAIRINVATSLIMLMILFSVIYGIGVKYSIHNIGKFTYIMYAICFMVMAVYIYIF